MNLPLSSPFWESSEPDPNTCAITGIAAVLGDISSQKNPVVEFELRTSGEARFLSERSEPEANRESIRHRIRDTRHGHSH